MERGKLIVIEGGDGSGKQTQTRLLVDKMESLEFPVETIDFPRYKANFYGQVIRAYLDGAFGDPLTIDPRLAGTLYCLDRFESRHQLKRWLLNGRIIISDRYHTANIIHQGAKILAREGEINDKLQNLVTFLNNLEFNCLKNPTPDLVVYLHVYPAVAQKMMAAQGRKIDGHEADVEYAKRVEQVALWAGEKLGWTLIECCPDQNSILPPEKIHEKIWTVVSPLISPPFNQP